MVESKRKEYLVLFYSFVAVTIFFTIIVYGYPTNDEWTNLYGLVFQNSMMDQFIMVVFAVGLLMFPLVVNRYVWHNKQKKEVLG